MPSCIVTAVPCATPALRPHVHIVRDCLAGSPHGASCTVACDEGAVAPGGNEVEAACVPVAVGAAAFVGAEALNCTSPSLGEWGTASSSPRGRLEEVQFNFHPSMGVRPLGVRAAGLL